LVKDRVDVLMPIKRLTTQFIKSAKHEGSGDRTIFWDESLPSFGLMVTNTGHRSYIAQYRTDGGQSRRSTIGHALKIDLEVARKLARQVFGEVAGGGDPALERRMAAESERNTFRAVAGKYLAREGGQIRTAGRRRATLARAIFPRLGDRCIDDISRSDIVNLLDDVEDASGPASANEALSIIRRIMNWHAARSDTFKSPIVPGMSRSQTGARERILTDEELAAVWLAAESFDAPWSQFIRLLLLTAARRSEVAGMKWSEIEGPTWKLPAERCKTGAELERPLSGAALFTLATLPRFHGSDFVFTTNGRAPIGAFSNFKLRFDIACGVRDWTLHDLRRTARSLMSRAGVDHDVAERCLGHAITGVRGVYDRHRYIEEMRIAFEKLATQIDRIVRPQHNVIGMVAR
jgi:integrase